MCFHLFISLISCRNVLTFSLYKSFASLVKLIPKYFFWCYWKIKLLHWSIGCSRVCCLISKKLLFPVLLLLLISNFNLLQLEKIFCTSLKIYWDLTVLLLLGRVFCVSLLDIVGLLWWVLYFLTYILSGCSIHYWEWDIEVSNYYCRTVHFSLQFCPFLLHIFW